MSIGFRRLFGFLVLFLVSPKGVIADDRMREIGDGVYSFTQGDGSHSMITVGTDGVAVFETFNPGHAEEMLAAIRVRQAAATGLFGSCGVRFK